jgi:hypothetical protein
MARVAPVAPPYFNCTRWSITTMPSIFMGKWLVRCGLVGLFGVEGLDKRFCWGFWGWATAIFLFRLWAVSDGQAMGRAFSPRGLDGPEPWGCAPGWYGTRLRRLPSNGTTSHPSYETKARWMGHPKDNDGDSDSSPPQPASWPGTPASSQNDDPGVNDELGAPSADVAGLAHLG